MAPITKEIERQALELPPEEREELASHLLQSLDNTPLNAVDGKWIAEAERRYENFKTGKTQGIPAEQLFEQIRRELGWQT